jgi:DNA polymerase-1
VSRPKEDINYRHLFRAAPGYKVVGADYSQIELRILAEMTKEPRYLEAYRDGRDLHAETARLVMGTDGGISSEQRSVGKVINFGVLAYGGGAGVLCSEALNFDLLISVKDARRWIRKLREETPVVERWGQQMHAAMLSDGYIQVPTGHRRHFLGENRITVARNTPVQMFAGGILKDAMCRIFDRFSRESLDATMILQMHDEVAVEVVEEQAKYVEKVVREEMVAAGERWLHDVPVLVDSYISDTWEK